MSPAVVWAVVRRPRLWPAAVGAWWRVRRRGGFGPSREWWEWRLHTAYGEVRTPHPEDVVAWLQWSRDFQKSR